MKKVLVLAGGFPQIALIGELHSRGYYVVLADYNENPVAKAYADRYYRISTLDVDAIRNVAVQECVCFLITACTDQALLTVAKVSEELELPCYIDYKTALNVTNKQYMKDMFARYGIPSAKHIILGSFDAAAMKDMTYPLIVKPVDCNSSKGVRRCDNNDELQRYFSDAVQYSRTKTAIIEEFVEGREITVDVYVENGVAHLLSYSNSEKIKEKDKFVIFRSINPASVTDEIVEQIQVVAQQIADAFHLQNSPMLIQMLSDGRKVYVIEFSARTGGGVKYLLIKHVSGFDVIKAVVDLTEGLLPHYEESVAKTKYLVNDFIYCKKGIYDHIEGFEELQKAGIIKDYYVFTWQGAEFSGDVKASGDRVAGYTVVGNTIEELLTHHEKVNESVRIVDPFGNDIMRHDLITKMVRDGEYLLSE